MQRSVRRLALFLFVLVSPGWLAQPARAATVELITRDPASGAARGGTLGALRGQGSSVSADGRYVATRTELPVPPLSLGPVVEGAWYDRLSHASGSIGSSGRLSFQPHISADGRFIAFDTYFDTLTVPSASGWVLDRTLGTFTLIAGGFFVPGLEMSAGGRWLTLGSLDLADRLAPGTGSVAIAPSSGEPTLAADARAVAFTSGATGLVPGMADTNGATDVFLWDRATGARTLVSRAAGLAATGNGASSLPEVSGDGQIVIFRSAADDLVAGQAASPDVQLFAFDQATGATVLVSRSLGSPTVPANAPVTDAALSADGRVVAFVTAATDVVSGQSGPPASQIFLFDRLSGETALASRAAAAPAQGGNGASSIPTLSGDGRYLAFASTATDLVPGQVDSPETSDVFVYDRATGTTTLASRQAGSPTTTANGDSTRPEISADGTTVVFDSLASDLAPGDANGAVDVYAFRRDTHPGAYFTVPPCRLVDTRAADQGPGLAAGVPASWPFHARCGIPSTARAVSLNLTVVPSQVGWLALFPGDLTTLPTVSTINFRAGQVKANNAVVSLAGDGTGTLAAQAAVGGGGMVHVMLDVTGFFE